MSPVLLLLIWTLGSFLVAVAGRRRRLGFWGFFIVSLIASPLLVAAVLLLTSTVEPRPS